MSQAQWLKPVTLLFRKGREEDCYEVSLEYIMNYKVSLYGIQDENVSQ